MMPHGPEHDEVSLRSKKGDYREGRIRKEDAERLGRQLGDYLRQRSQGHQGSTQGTGPNGKVKSFTDRPDLAQIVLAFAGNRNGTAE